MTPEPELPNHENELVAEILERLQDLPPARQVGIVMGVLGATLKTVALDPQALKIFYGLVDQLVVMTEEHKWQSDEGDIE
jgi:hypothetical protein